MTRSANGPRQVALTLKQQQLVREAADVPRRAALRARKASGSLLDLDELQSIGRLAVAKAAQTYLPAAGRSFDDWAFYQACFAMLDAAREQRRESAALGLRRDATRAYVSAEPPAAEAFVATDEVDDEKLAAFCDGYCATLWLGPAMTEGDPLLQREESALATETLHRVLAALRPDQQRMLSLVFRDGKEVKEAAKVDGTLGYRAYLRRFHALLQLVGARLRALGMDAPPARMEGDGLAVLQVDRR